MAQKVISQVFNFLSTVYINLTATLWHSSFCEELFPLCALKGFRLHPEVHSMESYPTLKIPCKFDKDEVFKNLNHWFAKYNCHIFFIVFYSISFRRKHLKAKAIYRHCSARSSEWRGHLYRTRCLTYLHLRVSSLWGRKFFMKNMDCVGLLNPVQHVTIFALELKIESKIKCSLSI